MTKIEMGRVYRTRDGREVRIYATDGAAELTVHGAVKLEDGWEVCAWRSDGRLGGYTITDSDLIEVKPRIKREVWVNVYRQDDGYEFATYHDNATDAKSDSGDAIIARAHLILDVEEGDGL